MLVIFDIANTVLVHEPSIAELYATVLQDFGVTVSPAKVAKARSVVLGRRRFDFTDCVCADAQRSYESGWQLFNEIVLREIGLSHDLSRVATRIHEMVNSLEAGIRVVPHFRASVRMLRDRGWTIGALSNGGPYIRKWLRRMELDSDFAFMLTSKETGHLKPCRQAFAAALNAAGASCDHLSVFVGDDVKEDGEGALFGGFDAAIVIGPGSPYGPPDGRLTAMDSMAGLASRMEELLNEKCYESQS